MTIKQRIKKAIVNPDRADFIVADGPEEDYWLQRDEPNTNWKRYLPEYFTSNSEHARFMRKLDILVFGYSLLSSFIQTLDTQNINNAYVSGMQDDLKLFGNELNIFGTLYDCGVIVGTVPLILATAYFRPSILLPTCELLWSIFVFACAGASSAKTIYACRFLIGIFESVAFPGFTALISGWYLPEEMGKRIVLYEISGNVASMFSGYIQAGLYSHMNGRNGLAAWQWLFIFDGIISIPVIIFGYIFIPDSPTTTRSKFLSDRERKYAVRRMELAGRRPVQKLNKRIVKNSLSTWHIYAFVFCYYLYGTFSWGDSYFSLWLQYLGIYTTEQINEIPTASQGAAIVNSFISSYISDYFQHRPIIIAINMLICLLGNAFVANWGAPTGLKFLGYMMITIGWPAQALTMAWANEVCQGNPLTRWLIVALGNTFVYATNAWLQVVIFPSSVAPHYKAGYQVCAAFLGLAILSVWLCWYLLQRDYKTGRAIKNDKGLPEYPEWDRFFAQEERIEHEANIIDTGDRFKASLESGDKSTEEVIVTNELKE